MRWSTFLLIMLLPLPGLAATADVRSGPDTVALVELYTSEGCSSCPPADVALSRLVQHDGLWQRIVPVAFHVGYWDDLGWPDRFAQPEFGRRQGRYASLWGHGVVYTPGWVLHGQQWRPHDVGTELARLASNRKAGHLRARLSDDGAVTVEFRGTATGTPLSAHVALLGFGLSSEVKAGENTGRVLEHDFVALDHATTTLSHGKAHLHIDTSAGPAQRRALAVWVSPSGTPAPLQAAGGWIRP